MELADLLSKNEQHAFLPFLSAHEKDVITQLLTSQTVLWAPQPGPQTEAYLSEADETLYGGAAGGGKTDLALGLAITAHTKSIIFRREYPQLRDIILRSKDILLSSPAKFNGQDHTWRDIPGHRSIEFGAVQYVDDWMRYKGRPHDLVVFDELTEFLEMQYVSLLGWARTTDPHQRVRILGTTNPPTLSEGEWVIRRWAPWLDRLYPYPAAPGELRWYAMVEGKEITCETGARFLHKGEEILPRSRTFIPARLDDNAYLAQTGYRAVLQSLPEPLRSQLLYGDFAIGIGDHPWQVIPTAWIQLAHQRWEATGKPELPQHQLGVDVARGGQDKTVIAKRYGQWIAPLVKYPGKYTPDGPEVAAYVLREREAGASVSIDVVGVGASAYDFLVHAIGAAAVDAVNNATKTDTTDASGQLQFTNTRAELYWLLREALDPAAGATLALPPDAELLADLTAAHYEIRLGKIKVEEKEEIIKRLGRSPDCADAVVLAMYEKPQKKKMRLTTPLPSPPPRGEGVQDVQVVPPLSREEHAAKVRPWTTQDVLRRR